MLSSDFLICFIVLGSGIAALVGGLLQLAGPSFVIHKQKGEIRKEKSNKSYNDNKSNENNKKPSKISKEAEIKKNIDSIVMMLTTGVVLLAAVLSLVQLVGFTFGGGFNESGRIITLLRWMEIGNFQSTWSIRLDSLSVVMMAVVTIVSGLVHVYSWGYMAETEDRSRFFSYLSLFTFTMLMLVSANDLVQLFFGWEGVGLASYLLIGFWYSKVYPDDRQITPNAAAIKAFITNRVGDFGLALGIMGVYFVFKSIELGPILQALRDNSFASIVAARQAFGEVAPTEVMISIVGIQVPALELIGVLLFVGAMGKSAQFVLHVWLPDAMEGPTPVSALIHAATMVTAGVYLVCLMSPLYEHTEFASAFITIVGAVTALFAATVGLAQNDIKRVIAYSTCSQLGYMFFAAGIGAYEAAMFHLFTHAFFKALLFLGAGSVIHGSHHQQDMTKLGGLVKYQKYTYAAMLIGTVAIIGVGLPNVWGLSGFYSKDAIIESAFVAGQNGVTYGMSAFWIGVVVAFLTSCYSWRLIYLTFHGQDMVEKNSRVGTESEEETHEVTHPHESELSMLIPLGLLALGAIFAGGIFAGPMLTYAKEFWGDAIYWSDGNSVYDGIKKLKEGHTADWVFWTPLIATLLGFALATYAYFVDKGLPNRLKSSGGPLYNLFKNKWYFDELYQYTLVRGTRVLSNMFWKVGDEKLIDRYGPMGAYNVAITLSRKVKSMHTGYIYHYAIAIILGIMILGGILYWQMGGGN